MSNLGIKSRVLFLAIIPILIVAILLTAYSISNSLHTLDEAMRERGRIIATQLAPASEYGVVSGNHAMLQPLVQQAITNESEIESVLIVDEAGRTLAVTGRPITDQIARLHDHTQVEWQYGQSIIFSAPIIRSLVEIDDYPIITLPNSPKTTDDSRIVGHVYVALTTQGMSALKNSLILHNLLIALIGLAISGLLAWVIGRSITRPIKSLASTVNQVGDGYLNAYVQETSSGELLTLQQGFNAMIANLKGAYEQMQERINEATLKLSYQAHYDALTGLVNRHEFERRLDLLLKSAHEHNAHHVFCYMDLDQFKVVNDTCGHSAGDGLLQQISLILSKRVRENDTLARLGGDEFGLLLENCSIADAHSMADGLLEMVQDFRYVYQDKIFNIGVSIGMVAITRDTESVSRIMSAADTACYAAKDNGRNRVHLYRAQDDEMAKRHGEMEWVGRLTRAMAEERFRLYYQPIVPLKSCDDRRRYFEILLRKLDTNGRIYLPMAFIPAAERYLLMSSVDRWVIRNTFAEYRQLMDNSGGETDCIFTINLSGVSLSDKTLLGFIREQFTIHAVPPEAVCFEVTETSAIVNMSNTLDLMNALKAMGCRFMLDDFGSGMSSFAYLKNLPVDFLKIDGTFVRDIAINPVDLAMVQSIHSIANAMKIKTIAEFVETAEVLPILESIGVQYAQGFYVGHEAPIEQLYEREFKSRARETGD
ncbi:Cyclic di-GMP phosphodiesterase PdeB [Methylophilaceae bacterium]|nr:Cyclic di-GMP phosphodiesterase PdeB [Methylophilaceae bacterium]